MDNEKTLNALSEGREAKVKRLLNDKSMRCRLCDLGLIEGSSVLCLQRSLRGGPSAYLIRGAVIALRKEDSSKILVEAV
ncbi:MAG: ferrous iron transport protein A [Oscillospiraceae bacterium]|nr:ferrous iron transport protein A [Oscillospiraceae bacterium]